MNINKSIEEAYSVLDEEELSYNLALELMKIEGVDLPDLLSLANKVTAKYAQKEHICSIMNAKSGKCSEDCKFCAQSSFYKTGIDTFSLVSAEEMLKEATIAYENVDYFGIVTSGVGYKKADNPEFQEILRGVKLIKEKFPNKKVCCTIGILSPETADALKEVNIAHYNINFQTNPEKYEKLVSTTHKIEDKLNTIKLLQDRGIKICTGGIIGVGESSIDRVKLAFSLKDAGVDSIPINILIPIKGTPLENNKTLSISEIVKSFAIFRLINPTKIIKIAAGRESVMKDYQALLMLAGANGFLTGGYLTTRGRGVEEDIKLKSEINKFRN